MIGQAVRRLEDARVLLGRTRYLDDIELPGLAQVAFVRSPHAHAGIEEILVPEAPGVTVLTAADLDGLVRPYPLPALEGAQLASEPHPVLPHHEVRLRGTASRGRDRGDPGAGRRCR